MHEAISKKNCIPVIIVSVIVSKNVHFPGLPKQKKQSCGKIKHSALTSFPCVSIITIYLTGKLELLTDPDEMLTLHVVMGIRFFTVRVSSKMHFWRKN